MKTKNKKGQESLVSTKLIGIILLVLVILGLLMFLMKPDFLDWIRNLPGYETPEDRTIDESGISNDTLTVGCEIKIASIGTEDISHWYNRGVDSRIISVYREGKTTPEETKIFVEIKNKEVTWLLKIKNPSWKIWQSDFLAGQIAKGILKISPDIMNNYNSSEIKPYVSLDDLKLLDGSFLYSQTSLCKSK